MIFIVGVGIDHLYDQISAVIKLISGITVPSFLLLKFG